MQLLQAREIVKKLANGIDPITGEKLPDSSLHNHAEIIRALFALLEHTKQPNHPKKTLEEKQLDNQREGRPKNAGLPWSEELRIDLITMFKQGMSINQMSVQLQRTQSAVSSELVKLRLIEPTPTLSEHSKLIEVNKS
ncbi:MAG: hypothetical protein WA154_15220 [Moraxellaceae bacterium]